MNDGERVSRVRLILAFAIIYVVWGSTYLAIRIGLETMPPFLLAGIRFLTAGALLFAWVRLRGAPAPSAAQWKAVTILAILMLVCANGAVTWSEQRAPSGLVALIVTSVPLWMVLLDWLRPGGVRPTRSTLLGLVVGSCGVVLLVDPGATLRDAGVPPLETAVLMLGTACWAAGSLYSRQHKVGGSTFLLTSLQMLVAGAILLALAGARGEFAGFAPTSVSLRSWAALAYLVLFGSIAALSAYLWLTRATTPARLGTYAYVNPVVALLLGAALVGERLTPRVGLAALLLLGAVGLITVGRAPGIGRIRR